MGLFIKKPDTGTYVPMYSLRQQETWLVVGLGNIGPEYDNTRHNAGFTAVDMLAAAYEVNWQEKPSLKCLLGSALIHDKKVIFCKPTTFMNESGQAVQAIKHFYKIDAVRVIVLHDELALKLGDVRTRQGGSDAGNNGVKSVSQHISEDYWRVRIGIGPKKPDQIDSADFVLKTFTPAQKKKLPEVITTAVGLTQEIIQGTHEPTTKRL